MSTDVRIDAACPTCDTRMDDWTAFRDGAQPKPGDVFVCFYCAEILTITRDEQPRYVVHPAREQLVTDPHIARIRAEIVGRDRNGSSA